MYAEDTFFHLTGPSRAGLLVLSVVLAVGMLTLARRMPAPSGWNPLLVLLLFWLFIWLSPEAYYIYFRTVLDGLPAQMVTGYPPRPGLVLRIVTFTGEATLRAHGQGILFWAMVAARYWPRRRR